MDKSVLRQHIAYRCPGCAVATVGLLGRLTSVGDMLRLKCECGASTLDIKRDREGMVKLDVPCVYCKTSHSYVVSTDVLTRDGATKLSCPYSSQDILFIADGEEIGTMLDKSAKELEMILASFEADELSDIQPKELDEADFEPDAAMFDVLNFVLRDLESADAVSCPCKRGPYSLRFCDEGAEVVCSTCGASYIFHATSQASAESYLYIDEIKLS